MVFVRHRALFRFVSDNQADNKHTHVLKFRNGKELQNWNVTEKAFSKKPQLEHTIEALVSGHLWNAKEAVRTYTVFIRINTAALI